MGHSGRAVQRAFKLGSRLMALLVEPGIDARSGVEERRRRPHKAGRTRAVEPEVFREAEMGECIPTVGASFGRGVGGVHSQEPPHSGVVAQNRRRVNDAGRNARMRRENRLGAIKRSRGVPGIERHAGSRDELRYGIGGVTHFCLPLFITQRLHRVHAHCATCGQVTGKQRYQQEQS